MLTVLLVFIIVFCMLSYATAFHDMIETHYARKFITSREKLWTIVLPGVYLYKKLSTTGVAWFKALEKKEPKEPEE